MWLQRENKSVCVKPNIPLKRVITQQLKKCTISRKMTYGQYCTENQLPKQYRLFLELDTFTKGKNKQLDVILMDKVSPSWLYYYTIVIYLGITLGSFQSTEDFYTGPTARQMVRDYYQGRKEHDAEKWKLFVLCNEFQDSLELMPSADVLEYQAW